MEHQDRIFERPNGPTRTTSRGDIQARAELDVVRTLCQAALVAFREEVRKGACERRVQQARAEMVVWRDRMETLLRHERR